MPNRRPFPVLIALFTLFASASFAVAAPQGPVAQVSVSPNMIQWRVLVPSESLTLRISAPDGETYTFESKGQTINVTPKDLGESAVDGTFTYDLVVTPPVAASVRAKLNEARKKNDDAAARKIARQAGLDRQQVESGAFALSNGAFVSPDRPEGGATGAAASSSSLTTSMASGSASGTSHDSGTTTARRAPLVPVSNDQVIADDLIVQGSTCIGLDCVINESFGFDTIRMKENNTRIKFDDTSTSAGFPATDWQLTANDSASGGASKFSIEDVTNAKVPFTVLANAPTNSLFVSSNGKLGLRTSSPVLDIHAVTTDTPAIRLEQTSGGGFTAQTWDVAGNEANFFVRDVTGGSRLPLRIRPGAPTSSIDIAASGNVGVGTAQPNFKLDVVGSVNATAAGYFLDAWRIADYAGNTARFGGMSGGQWTSVGIYTGGGERLHLDAAGNIGIGVAAPTNPIQHSNGAILTAGGVWQNASSRELKQDICDLEVEAARATLAKLDPVTFAYKIDPQEHHAGFIAEDVPDLVAAKDRKSLSAMDIVAVLTKVAQDQQKTIDQLSRRVEELEQARRPK